ncbi:MAG: hypothetical protein H6726_16760 [Sandaracinaceae bacterium]|nr:hypothetical protein [Sandaracinaceae bacterium]
MSVPSATSMVHLSHPRPLRLAPFALTWVALLTLALGLVGCGGRAPTGEPAHGTSGQEGQEDPSLAGVSRAPTDQERRIIQGLMRDASRVRNLAFLHEVPTEIQDEARIRAFVEADIEPDELAESRDLYTSLGLLPDDVDLEALLLEVLGEQIVGYYDPDGGRLVVRDDVMRSLAASSVDEARVVLVHELVHALQDQHLALGALNDQERDTDPDNAYRALVEGDATLAMMAYVLAAQGTDLANITGQPDILRRFFDAAPNAGADALGRAPAILRVTLMAPYTAGAIFCGDQHRIAGWPSVDAAHRTLPVTTEHVLHPDKYAAGELPDTITLPRATSLEALGFVRTQEDTLGELELSIYLAQGTSSDQDLTAAAGWSGDRLAIYGRADAPSAVVWWTSWDTEQDAREAEVAARRAGAETEGSVVLREGRAVLILRHVPTAGSGEIVAAFSAFARALPATPPRR